MEQRRGEKRRGDAPDDRERGDAGVGAVLPDCGEQEFDEDYDEVDTYDEKSGELLDPALVRKARAEEVELMGRIQLFKLDSATLISPRMNATSPTKLCHPPAGTTTVTTRPRT